jgi:aspartate aminotransferase
MLNGLISQQARKWKRMAMQTAENRSFVNRRMGSIPPSATLAVAAKAAELKAAGRSIVDLSTGEPEIDTPAHIKEACVKALESGKTKYAPAAGIPVLREALARKLTEENGVPTKASQVIVTNGGKQALFEALQVVLEEGDEVVIQSPYWVSYPAMVEMCGGITKVVETSFNNNFKLTPEALAAQLSKKTKVVIINSPSNPTGAMLSADEQRAIAAVLERFPEVIVFSDEVYERLDHGPTKFVSFAAAAPALADRVITINSFSKTYSMTGWRVGYAAGPESIVKAMINAQSQSTSGVNTPSQWGALEALRGDHGFLEPLRLAYRNRAVFGVEMLEKIPGVQLAGVPDGAFYLFIGVKQLLGKGAPFPNIEVFAKALLEEVGVAVVPGDGFGMSDAFRISVAVSEAVLKDGLVRIQDFIQAKL